MKKLALIGLIAIAAQACSTAQTTGHDSWRSMASVPTSPTANDYVCHMLGNNIARIITVNGNSLTTYDDGTIQTGTLQGQSPDGFAIYGAFTPAAGFFSSDSTLMISKELTDTGTGKVRMMYKGTWPYEDTCHRYNDRDARRNSCLSAARQVSGVEATQVHRKTERNDDGSYTVTIKDRALHANYVYHVVTTQTGLVCNVTSISPASCAAIVADKIGDRARDDGSSAGSPFVQPNGQNKYVAGIHDPESGEFVYDVVTSGDAHKCEITQITPLAGSQGDSSTN